MRMGLIEGSDRRTHNLPTTEEVAVVIPIEYSDRSFRDIILTLRRRDQETLDTIKKIQSSHKDNRKKSRYNSEETPRLLSEIINPSIIKLTENDHKKGMTDLGPFDSPEHD
ncbi:uncharacterized protein RHIMIDRAFT_293200 [Rhizopus microsporus ATCC 52813]|uniref:Uncharacterized protein n=1 Tax=Rhizopus microsporus ATCC 52813 TaxID=1340429 RepID=A0A2G4SQF3_RHIZD|nr:uncharacterized protein RHIMIDRAFT_293200 [Rhizopus microsporus ATCC 52813]PHZ11008.1 hypothetical protein RHIMIDRAFT_293200 [Rhizopus microsporus ATCC 52813]